MKIQGLAVIAILLILPMAILLNSYSANQIETLRLQIAYDSRLKSATYDGIKAFQLNMANSTTSRMVDSKMRDIKASIETFYNSLASQFGMAGYGEEELQNYVPAIVYTLYDGYYIYSAYNNKLDSDDEFAENASYKDGEKIYGLKPYIYYSCRYKKEGDFDVVITYSLDSYITIQGTVKGMSVNESGYLLKSASLGSGYINSFGQVEYPVFYKGVQIKEETQSFSNTNSLLRQKVYVADETNTATGDPIDIEDNNQVRHLTGVIKQYPYRKINGVKYYFNTDTYEIFSMINDEKIPLNDLSGFSDKITTNTNAKDFYAKAVEFKRKFEPGGNLAGLRDLSTNDAVDEKGEKYNLREEGNPYTSNIRIFDELFSGSVDIEDDNSKFNIHRKEVIKEAIEKNLTIAINNYNDVSTSSVSFQMPKLSDEEWDELTKNISMITFLQGLSIGGKVYNGYSMVRNDINEDFVSKDSIYILVQGDKYYKVTDPALKNINLSNQEVKGIYNVDFERRVAVSAYEDDVGNEFKKNIYYYPREDEGAYTSIIYPNYYSYNVGNSTDINKTIEEVLESNSTLKEIYYTALGRERYGMYRVNNPFAKKLE